MLFGVYAGLVFLAAATHYYAADDHNDNDAAVHNEDDDDKDDDDDDETHNQYGDDDDHSGFRQVLHKTLLMWRSISSNRGISTLLGVVVMIGPKHPQVSVGVGPFYSP